MTADTRPSVLSALIRSFLRTVALTATGSLAMPRTRVGEAIRFGDGSTSVVFRETATPDLPSTDPAVLVVEFQLSLIRQWRWAHAIFRLTSVVNTPLFAGFPGFRSKLWLSDDTRAVYRGFYQWDGPGAAVSYAETLLRVLSLVCVRGSPRFHVVPGARRDEALAGSIAGDLSDPEWWRPLAGLALRDPE